jgi:hypothetical protein
MTSSLASGSVRLSEPAARAMGMTNDLRTTTWSVQRHPLFERQ